MNRANIAGSRGRGSRVSGGWLTGCMSMKQRISPTEAQEGLLREHAAQARFIYNIGLEQRSLWTPAKRYSKHKINFATQSRELTELRGDLDWLRAGSTVVQQGALRDLDAAFQRFFDGVARYPTFKSNKDRVGGFVIRDLSLRRISRKWATILIPKVGWVKFRLTYPWAEATAASSARATLRNDQWHICLTSAPRPKTLAGTGRTVGIDVGVKNTIATSDGAMDTIPALSIGEQVRFLALQRRLSRQEKGSAHRARTLASLAKIYVRLGNRRTNWVEQTTTALSREYDFAGMEDLRIANMVRKPKPKKDPNNPTAFLPNGANAKAALNKEILASSWGKFATRLDHKMVIARINPKNTSRECRVCHYTAEENRKSQAVFLCMSCGHGEHADINAAKNIEHRALKQATQQASPTQGHLGDRASKPRKRAMSTEHQTAAHIAA